MFRDAFDVINEDKSVHILGQKINFSKEKQYVIDFINIQEGIQVTNTKTCFNTLNECIQYYRKIGKYKWVRRVTLFNEYGSDLINMYTQLEQSLREYTDADIVITTTHQAKGLEFDNVKLSSDFINLTTYEKRTLHIDKSAYAQEDYNILYVAMTRAKKNLLINEQMYSFLNIIKGTRSYKCKKCKMLNIVHENGINSIGFNSNSLYTNNKKCDCIR